MKTEMNDVLNDFEDYCTDVEIVSGKARSYKLAIMYLCDYLKISQFDNESIAKIERTAKVIRDSNSNTYKELLVFLTKRRQSSYLLKGWINAAVGQFSSFMKRYNQT
jgi:hypothetical protein